MAIHVSLAQGSTLANPIAQRFQLLDSLDAHILYQHESAVDKKHPTIFTSMGHQWELGLGIFEFLYRCLAHPKFDGIGTSFHAGRTQPTH